MIDHKVAIVTGGSSGIGRATAIALAQSGVKVAVASRRSKEGEESVHLIKEAGSDGIFVKTDVTNEDEVKSLVDKTINKYDRLDYAFNNAGIGEKLTSLTDQTSNTFDHIMDVNVKGVWLSMKYEIPEMFRTGGGAIVNTSSVAGGGIPSNARLYRQQTCSTWINQISCVGICKIWHQNKCCRSRAR
jgi:NAD(P)-dependent dehydrogenase (short-subunit alcohol dehydrogenase family)